MDARVPLADVEKLVDFFIVNEVAEVGNCLDLVLQLLLVLEVPFVNDSFGNVLDDGEGVDNILVVVVLQYPDFA